MALNDMSVRNAKAGEKPYKLGDSGGLYLFVHTSGGRLWRFDYRHNGKRKTLALGAYPDVSLVDARARRDEAKKQLANSIDPAEQKKLAKVETQRTAHTFASVVEEHLARKEHDGAAAATMDKNRWLLEGLAAPLAKRPIHEITPAEILDVLQRAEKRGKLESARRLRSAISGVFRFAVATLRAPSDPTYALVGATKAPKVESHAAIVDHKRLGWLMRSIDEYDGWPTLRSSMLLAALTAARPGEVRQAEWKEFDTSQRIWKIPAERQKSRRQHEVPLSDQSVVVLNEIKRFSGNARFVFPSIRSIERHISENGMNAALQRLGVPPSEHTPHGFRSSFSTIMNEHNENAEVIELCLSHTDKNEVRRIYNRAVRWPERVAMMQQWADMLDAFRKL